VNEYIWVLREMGIDFGIIWELLVNFSLAIANGFYIFWIAYDLFRNMTRLKERRQSEKLRLYQKLAWFLAPFIGVSVILYVLESAFSMTSMMDKMWTIWWIWDGYWELGYFFIIAIVGWLWRPTEHNDRYAYSIQLDNENYAEEMGQVDLSDDDDLGVASAEKLTPEHEQPVKLADGDDDAVTAPPEKVKKSLEEQAHEKELAEAGNISLDDD